MNVDRIVANVAFGLPETLQVSTALLLALVFFLAFLLLTGISYLQIPKILQSLPRFFASAEAQKIYHTVIEPDLSWLSWVVIITIVDLVILAIPKPGWVELFEIPLGLLVAINISLLGSKIFQQLYDQYLLGIALDDRIKINSDFLIIAKFLSNAVIVLIVIFLFAQTHQINLIGLVASLGVGGVAIAFASQKILEQALWSFVLFVDRPFNVDDYIHLPDGTLGRVESIGWRSTKIRQSGKNTLVIVPNSNLAQVAIENLTRARRVILIVNLTFLTQISDEERSLIHQLILDSTNNIVGIEHELTQVTFQDLAASDVALSSNRVRAQAVFFILGAAETSMELRRNLLEIARENILHRLYEYGLAFEFEEQMIDISQPMNM